MRRVIFLAALLACAVPVLGAEKSGLTEGTPDIKFAGPIAFGPDGIIFIGDTQQAAIFAIDTGDKKGTPSSVNVEVANVKEAIAGLLGVSPQDVLINDLTVNPASGHVFISVSRGKGPDAAPVLLKYDGQKFSEVSLKTAKFAKAALPNPPEAGGQPGPRNPRAQSITDLAYVDGRVFIAGLSNEEFSSNLRSIAFPFDKVDTGASIEIYHGAHGKYETRSPIRQFVPFAIKGEAHLLAAYTCTPLVRFRVSELKSGEKVKGTTVAELGNRNSPLDMIVYQRDGQDYLLIANTARGVMKVTTDKISEQEAITEPVRGGGIAGLKYETLADLKGVQQLDRLNENHAVLMIVDESGKTSLKTVPLP